MSINLECKLETKKDNLIFNTCSKLLENYNNATNQKLSYTFRSDFIIIKTHDLPDALNLFWYFNYHTIDTLDRQEKETVLSSYILSMLASRLIEIRFLDKKNSDMQQYVRTLYNLFSKFNFSFLQENENILYANKELSNLKSQFDNLYKSWL